MGRVRELSTFDFRLSTLAPGNILPLALVIVAIMVLGGLAVSAIVMEDNRRASETDLSTYAYYMADSGIERQLYEVRKKDSSAATLASLSMTFPNGGTWKYDAEYAQETQKNFSLIQLNNFAALDIFDPDNVGAAGVANLYITWENGPDCGMNNAELEVGWAEWAIVAGNIIPSPFQIHWPALDPTLHAGDVGLDVGKSYRIRLRPKACSAKNVNVRTCSSGSGAACPMMNYPGDLSIAAEGTYRGATQKISAVMPKTNVLSGLFNFVVFTEEELNKSGTP